MTKVEQVARAIAAKVVGASGKPNPNAFDLLNDSNREIIVGAARDAIEAMLNPTMSMVAAGLEHDERHRPDYTGHYNAMVQAALAEK